MNVPTTVRIVALLSLATGPACVAASHSDAPPQVQQPRDADRAAQEVIALVDEAAAQWDAACGAPHATGLCVHVSTAAADPTRCATPWLEFSVDTRERDASVAALGQFDDALDLAGSTDEPDEPEARARYRHALARAQLAQLDAQLEAYLTMTMPSDLGKFQEWWTAKSGLGEELIVHLAEFKGTRDIESIVGAAMRTSWVSLALADALRTAEVPAEIRDDAEQRAQYCGALESYAASPAAIALDAARWCEDRAADAAYEGPEVTACEQLAAMLDDPGPGDRTGG